MVFKLKIVAEAEAVENNSEIAREYGVSPLLAKGSGQTVQRRIEYIRILSIGLELACNGG